MVLFMHLPLAHNVFIALVRNARRIHNLHAAKKTLHLVFQLWCVRLRECRRLLLVGVFLVFIIKNEKPADKLLNLTDQFYGKTWHQKKKIKWMCINVRLYFTRREHLRIWKMFDISVIHIKMYSFKTWNLMQWPYKFLNIYLTPNSVTPKMKNVIIYLLSCFFPNP